MRQRTRRARGACRGTASLRLDGAASDTPRVSTAERVGSRFTIEAEAGRGGMGVVYRARDETDGALVALKLMHGDGSVELARFEREARLVARLSHPGVVRYVDHGRTHDGSIYLAMEWLEGETLAERTRREPLSPREAARAVRAAAEGLGAAHELGIVHRDVKPANLFLVGGAPERVKVIDFGIARPPERHELTLTTTGTVVGTPYYMAPEQARADAGVDARADVYALGAVLYELLTGRPPFANESLMALLAAILLEEPLDVRERAPDVPDALAALTMRLLDKSPEARPADGRALARAIDELGELRGGAGPRSVLPPALTEREQRVLCLVLGAGRAAPLSHAATIASGTEDAVGRMRAAVEAHGGRLEALADGSLVARVEASATPTEQAVRAARCAIAMRAIAPEVPLVLVAGRGMMRGPLPVGEVIERGGAILRGVLAPGAPTLPTGAAEPEPVRCGIRVDEVMAGLLEGRYEIARGPLGATLGEERREPTTARTLLGRTTPCVGRRRELATLEALFAECVEEPIARVAWITAPPGGGKSRLVAELVDRVTEREAPAVWIARGDPIGAGSPFGLLAQLVRAASGIADGEPLEARRAKILASVGGAIGGERGRLAAVRLGSVARTPFEDQTSLPPDDPKLRGDAMREAFVEWLAAATGERPLLVVLDDLQWGDRPSLAFVSAAVRALSDRPLCVLAAGRPEASELFDALFEERDVELLRLARLTPRAAEELARHVLGRGADDALIARLVERADGNPFFLEELVRAVEESRGEGALPTTVLGMVEARLEVLDASTRRVLRAASVFGKRFWKGGVIELLGGAPRAGDVDAHLAVLAQRELVDRVSDPRLTGQSELAFRSVLTREAALAMLTDEDRRLGHRLAGAWLETAGERDALVLAEHFSRGGDEARAATWLGRAAEQALEGDDLAAAVDRAERALAAASEPARGPILVTLADAHRWRGEYAQAFAHAALAAEALEPGTRAWFRALGVLFAAAGRVGRAWEAEPWRERAVSIEAHPDASGAQVVALCRAAALALASGDLARFEATLERAERLAHGAARGDSLARAWILTMRASWAAREGDQGAFVDGTEEAVRAYEAAGDARDACNQKVRLANGYIGLGDVERAEVVLREALTAARRMSLPLIEGYALQNLGHALLRKGAIEDAAHAEEQAIALARRLQDPVLEAGCLLYLAEAHERAGRAADAVRDAGRAVELLAAAPPFRTVARAVLARAVLASGEREAALAHAEEAARALATHALEEGEALVQLVHAEALLAGGREDEARERAREAAARLEERAAKIADRGWRDAFLHRVPSHARLLTLARG